MSKKNAFDVIIISTSDKEKEEYWQNRLNQVKETICPNSKVIVIHEDWPGGAGNGLGTLYAYEQAKIKGEKLFGVDLFKLQKEGASISLYHTAGKGTRLYPLTPSEWNNKSAIKLPALIGSPPQLLTILEATILQTSIYAASRPGRLSVFWGDQLFVPTKNTAYTPTHPIDLLVKLGPLPTDAIWKSQNLESYGLLAIDGTGNAQQLEKTTFSNFKRYIDDEKISITGGVGISLGCFSLSKEMTFSLLNEFKYELHSKQGLLNSDYHFWMPMTLDEETYLELVKETPFDAKIHYHRMQRFREQFSYRHASSNFLGIVDIGSKAYFWDLGTVDHYFANMLKLISNTQEGHMMRLLLGIGQGHSGISRVVHDDDSILINCNIRSGTIKNSILMGVNADTIEVSHSLIINSELKKVKAENTLLYNVKESETIDFKNGTIRADTRLGNEYLKFYTQTNRDSLKDWNILLDPNPFTYAELHKKMIIPTNFSEL